MNPFVVFLLLVGCVIGLGIWMAHTLDVGDAIKAHAKHYLLPYVKGTTLVAIAIFVALDEALRTLQNYTAAEVAALAWYQWATIYTKPVVAGLTVLAAFLDRSLAQSTRNPTPGSTPHGSSP